MCDEESFVILGSTPTPSMEQLAQSYATETASGVFSSLPEVSVHPEVKMPSIKSEDGAVGGETVKEESMTTSKASSDTVDSVKAALDAPLPPDDGILTPPDFQLNSTVTQSLVSWPEASPSLSTSHFNIYSEFPSMKGQNIASQDLSKLENFYCEHNQLKENLLNSNRCLRQYFALAEKWQNEIREFKRQQDVYQTHVVGENERLRGVVEQLEARLREKNAELDAIRAENRQSIEALSEQHDRELQALRVQMEELKVGEHERRSSVDAELKWRQEMAHMEFTMSEKLRAAEVKEGQFQQEMAGLTEKFSADMYEMRHKLAQEVARVAELEGQCKVWHEENDCLRVNLTAAEELNAKLRADVAEVTQQVEQIEAFKMQSELFKADFEAERAARTVLVGEKDQLLADLRLLQNRHEQLIGEMESMRNPRSGYPHPEPQRSQFRCPICSRSFTDLSSLNRHINDCLDNS
ncbi:NF-kappa-B essential modulator [Phlebotomus argentipes]|uniref:NF-kappa-B essential modulator n=1 Tax=Phlebotomus argentipes TaxID=94469 RepID=UPI002892D959|nr:NF-kappa-B essential modulator [Phlebotomus argentipes]